MTKTRLDEAATKEGAHVVDPAEAYGTTAKPDGTGTERTTERYRPATQQHRPAAEQFGTATEPTADPYAPGKSSPTIYPSPGSGPLPVEPRASDKKARREELPAVAIASFTGANPTVAHATTTEGAELLKTGDKMMVVVTSGRLDALNNKEFVIGSVSGQNFGLDADLSGQKVSGVEAIGYITAADAAHAPERQRPRNVLSANDVEHSGDQRKSKF